MTASPSISPNSVRHRQRPYHWCSSRKDLLEIRAIAAYKAVGHFSRVVSDTTASGERHVNRASIATFRENAFVPYVCLIVLHVNRAIAWPKKTRTWSLFVENLRQSAAKKPLQNRQAEKIEHDVRPELSLETCHNRRPKFEIWHLEGHGAR